MTVKKPCIKCEKEKKLEDFYKSPSPLHNGFVPVCKVCIKNQLDMTNIHSVKDTLRMIDRPFIDFLWENSVAEAEEKNRELFGTYMKNLGLKKFRDYTWKDSTSENNSSEETVTLETHHEEIEDLEYLKEMYGYGYPDEQYMLFEKKFQQLKPSFQLVTTMHEEYLREYCINKVKETLAKAKGDFKEAKEWASMAKDAADAGKLKPSQMSKADLSQGLDGFGQLARMVEERVDIIPILPKFVQQPKDKPDVVLWCYLNYIRDLQGLPEADYKDIYHFYEERREDYERQELDNDPSMREEANGK